MRRAVLKRYLYAPGTGKSVGRIGFLRLRRSRQSAGEHEYSSRQAEGEAAQDRYIFGVHDILLVDCGLLSTPISRPMLPKRRGRNHGDDMKSAWRICEAVMVGCGTLCHSS